MVRRTSDVCLATVATEAFLPGVVVTAGSFLKRHPDFDVDVVIIHDGLSEERREFLNAALPCPVRFVPVSSDLRDRLARVGAAEPRLAPLLCHLHALEAWRLTGYRKVLLCDGDLLFRQPIGELFETGDPLLCCGDYAYLAGRYRDAATFRPLDGPDGAGPAGVLERTFNDGFLLIDAGLAGEDRYADLLSMVTPETWRGVVDGHFKQFLHNRYFHGRHTLVSSTYNFVVRYAALIEAREGLAARDAKVLHFNVSVKPWMDGGMLRQTSRDGPDLPFMLWYQAWADCLFAAHLRTGRYSRIEPEVPTASEKP